MNNKIYLAAFAAAASLITGQAYGADEGFYLGAGIGYTRATPDNAGVLASSGAPAGSSISSDKSSFGWKEYGGYQFNKNIALELSFADLGKYDFTFTRPGFTPATGKITINGFGISAVGILPLDNKFSLIGRLGGFYSTLNASTSINAFTAGTATSGKDRKFVPNFGVGANYELTKSLGLRAEIERFSGMGSSSKSIKTDVNLLSAGVYYRF